MHHHHLIVLAKVAIAAGAILAAHQMQHPGNGLTAPGIHLNAHPITATGKK